MTEDEARAMNDTLRTAATEFLKCVEGLVAWKHDEAQNTWRRVGGSDAELRRMKAAYHDLRAALQAQEKNDE
jgi:hypothetical protein